MSVSTSNNLVDLFGWDTAFAIRYAEVNQAIRSAGSSPQQFSQSDQVDGYSVSGDFDNWAVIPGGSGDLLRMEIPFHDTTLQTPTEKLTGLQGRIEVLLRLQFVPLAGSSAGAATSQQSTNGVQKHQLMVRPTPQDAEKAASIDCLKYSGAEQSLIVGVALRMLLEDWLNDNLEAFHHVFAVAELNRQADKKGFQWLQPTMQAYSCADFGKDDGIFGILSMTGQHSGSELPSQLSPFVIPDGQTATLAISGNRVLVDLLLPVLPQIFVGSKLSDFKLPEPGAHSISLANGPVNVAIQDPKSGTRKQCQLKAFEVSLFGNEIRFDATTCVDVQLGVLVYTRTQSNSTVVVDEHQCLRYTTATPTVDHWLDKTGLIKSIEATILEVITDILRKFLDDAEAKIVASIIYGIVTGPFDLLTDIVQLTDGNDAPSITPMAADAVSSIQWAQSSEFKLTTAALNGSLQLSGKLN